MQEHFWTVMSRLGGHFGGDPDEAAEPWRGVVVDADRGALPLGGRIRHVAGSDTAVVLVHGLGGCCDSRYLTRMASAFEAAGASTLRLGLRGSDGAVGDFYHAGLTTDLAAALACPELAAYRRVAIVGFSLGGHLTLRYATEDPDPRLVAVAAVCAPLELLPAQRAFDRPAAWLYRRYILGRLQRLYREIARHGELPTAVAVVRRARTLREWDNLTVVPRFGFASPEDYYARVSVGPRLRRLAVPALLVACPTDPMVSASSIVDAAAAAGGALDLRWVRRGGHIAFPGDLDLGVPAARGLTSQLAGWLLGPRGEPPCREGVPSA